MPIPEPPADYNLWPDVRAITGWPTSDEDQIRTLAAGWRAGGDSFTRAGGHDVSALAGGWSDRAGQTFHANVGTTLRRATAVGAGMTQMAGHADTFAAELTGVKQGINDLMAKNIDLYGREVATLPDAVRPAAHAGFVQQLAGMVNEMMTASAARIGAAGPIQGIDLARSAEPAGPVIPPEFAPGTDPAKVLQAWESLSDSDHYAILNSQPDLIRGLDGIPAGFRNLANRAVLDRELASLREQESDLFFSPPGTVPGDLDQVRRNIEGLQEIRARLDGDRDLYLLGLDPSGDGKAIIASGNPDTARNVITHVPGVGHDLATVTDAEALDRAISLRQPPGGGPPDPGTSAVFWLGYDSPDGLGEGNSDSYAAESKADLQQFQRGLRALNADARLTVEGHSYGTTVIGHAAREQLAANHVVLVASTDPGVQSAGEYHLDRVDPADIRQHVHATQAVNDLIANAGTNRIGYGNDPTDPEFGADVFYTETTREDLFKHSVSYWEGNPALDTIRDIGQGTGNYAGYRG